MQAQTGIQAALISIALVTATPAALSQETAYPKKGNVEITVLFPAGSSADITARLLAQGMSRHLGANVITVNRPGAGGAIGYKHAAAQKPDGYSLVWNSNSISTTYHSGQLPFDYKSFDPVARVLVEPPLLAVRADGKWKKLADLVVDAKAYPGQMTVANSGTGSHTHITAVAMFKAAGLNVIHVPYSAAQVVPNLIGGHVDTMVQLPGALAAHVASGRIRILAALTDSRDPGMPKVPTARELGYNVTMEAWRGIAVPRGTPPAIIAQLETAIRATATSPEFSAASDKLYVRPAFLPAEAFGRMIAKEDAEMAGIMRQIGLKKSP
jgi:tripartite-type tricarboxylate transporter receptor subunit TctC